MHTHDDALAPRITVRGVFHWFRDRFAAFFATLSAWSLAWVAWAMLVAALFYWDGLFTRSLSPSYVWPESFMAVGWGLRIFVFVLPLIILRLWAARLRAWALVLATIWVVMQGIAFSHAFGFAVSGLEERQALAEAVTDVNDADRGGLELQVAALESQKQGIRDDRDRVIDAAQAAITNITTDGINNDDQADPYRESIDAANREAAERIAAIDAQITALFAEKREVSTAAAEEEATAREINPLFVQFATMFGGEDAKPRNWAIAFFIVLMGAVELIVALFPALFDSWQRHASRRAAERETEREEAEHELALAELASMRREAEDDLAAQQAEINRMRADLDRERDALDAAKAEPQPAPEPEPELTPAQRRGRKGAEARNHYAQADDDILYLPGVNEEAA